MNFLSHYHFYKSDDTYYNVGLVLPDLVRNICKTHLRPNKSYANPIHESLGKGSRDHIEGDRIFHQSEFFTVCQNHISDLLDKQAAWPRKWFLNHLLLEIVLDRALMDLNTNLCSDFYNQLEKCDIQELTIFLEHLGVLDFSKFGTGYARFVNFRFIFDYKHNEKIFFALSRVYLRTGIQYVWTEDDKHLLLQNLPEILRFIHTQLDNLKKELK